MKNIRIGNDIVIKWSVYRQGQPEDFSGKNISVSLHEPFTNTKADIAYIIEGNVVNISFFGKDQKKVGQYTLKLVENEGTINMHTIDHCNPFTLVSKSCMAGGKDDCSNIHVESVELESDINLPKNGESAYETALKVGFEGTEEEWIASLKGQKGDKGDKGETGPIGPQGEKGEKGADGTITFEELTEEQKASLKGDKGDTGDKGDKGDAGTTYVPNVDNEGNLSWTNNGGLENPTTINIKGPKGDKGDAYDDTEIKRQLSTKGNVAAMDTDDSISQRKVKDAKDLETNELVYFKGYAKATYMSDGRSVEDAINQAGTGGGSGGIGVEADPIFSASPASKITDGNISTWNSKQDKISDLETIRSNANKGAEALGAIPKKVSELENDKGYLTEHQDISNLATKNELQNKVDKVDGKQLSTEDFTTVLKNKLSSLTNYDDTAINRAVQSLQTQLNTLVSGNASTAVESFNEIVSFLEGIKDSQSLDGIIASIEQQISSKQDKITDLDTIRSGAAKGATALQVEQYTGTYSKPSGGIPKSDLASAVQTSLSKADTALQEHQDVSKKINGDGTITKIVKVSALPDNPDANTLYIIV